MEATNLYNYPFYFSEYITVKVQKHIPSNINTKIHIMKNILFLLFFSTLLSANAQTNLIGPIQSSPYADRMEHIFGNIDKSKVTTGYLKEFGIRFADMESCNGSLSSSNFVTENEWHALYNSLYTMRVGTVAMGMASPQSVKANCNTQQNNTSNVLLAVQHYNYQQYKKFARKAGDVIVFGDRIFDVAGRNPYETKTLFAVTPLKQYLQGDTFTFKVPSSLIYTNVGLSLSQIQIDFGNGQGYQTVSVNTGKTVSYTTGGEKEIKVKCTYSNGSVEYSHSKIVLNHVTQGVNPLARFDGSGATETIITGDPWNGSSASGRVTVELAPGHTQLTKPLIIIEGFDPDDSFDYLDLINDQGPGGLNIRISQPGEPFLTLNQAIEDEDYDLVFVDYVNSTDFIQRNAFMVEEVIRWVNNQKLGSEKNAVLGMSMGGLVGRYALRDMELNGETHETKLYISHDTPHQGANVPLAAQALVRHLVGEEISIPVFFSLFDINVLDFENAFPELTDALALLQSPAAQQMLVYQLQGTGNNVSVDNTTLHTTFLNEYKNMGYPQQGGIRNIAIANGNECGVPLGFNPYDVIADVDIDEDISQFDILILLVNALAVNPLKVISTVLSTDTDLRVDFLLRALPSQQSREIYKGRIFIEKKILFLITVHEPLIDEERVYSNSNMLALDNANGGIFDIENFADLPAELEPFVLQQSFGFIPIYSSLDLGRGNATITPSDLTTIYNPLSPPSAPKDVPFDNFFTNPITSTIHTQFTLNNGEWLVSELADTPEISSCAYVCEGVEIMGNNTLCDSRQYSLEAAIPSDAVVTWSVSNPSVVSLSNTTGVTTTLSTPPNSYRTNIVLTATVSSTTCQSTVSITKSIRVGKPGTPSYLNGPTVVNTGALVHYNAGIADGATSYKWWLPYPFDVSNPIDYFADNWQMAPTNHRNLTAMTGYAGNSGLVQVMGVNECGCGGAKILSVQHGNGGNGGGGIPRSFPLDNETSDSDKKFFEIYPNPTSGIMNITLKSSAKTILRQKNIEGKLFDLLGNLKRRVIISNNKAIINTYGLNTGVYVLKIYVNNTVEHHQVIVK